MPRVLEPVVMDDMTDWSGLLIPRRAAQHLFPGCVVRIVLRNCNTNSMEALYFRITKIKDGTFWGICQDTYRMKDYVGIADGGQMTFRKEHINEIPITWQPKRFQRAVAYLEDHISDQGYSMTGIRS